MNERSRASGRHWLLPLSGIGVAGAAVWIAAFVRGKPEALSAYLFAFAYTLTLVTGVLFLTLVLNVANAAWFVPLRRRAENIIAAMPVVALAAIPILVWRAQLYPFEHVEALSELAKKRIQNSAIWYTDWFFLCRSALSLLGLTAVAEAVRWASLRQDDQAPDDAERWRSTLQRLSVGGLLVVGACTTLGSWDWFMAVDTPWYSDAYGVYILAGASVGAVALLSLASVGLPGITSEHASALGRLGLATVIFWAYIAATHVIEQWLANLPAGTLWYAVRWENGWQWYGLALLVVHFLVPFLLLLFQAVKRNQNVFRAVCVWLMLAHAMDVFYLLVPSFRQTPALDWLDVVAALSLTSLAALAVLLRRSEQQSPNADPVLQLGFEYRSES